MENTARQELTRTDEIKYLSAVLNTIREPVLVLDRDLRVLDANRSFYRVFKVSDSETTGRRLDELGDGQWKIPALSRALEEIISKGAAFEDYDVEHDFPGLGRRIIQLNARKLKQDREKDLILLAMEDVTDRRMAAEILKLSEEKFRIMFEAMQNYAVFRLDREGIITSCIAGAERILGFREEELTGKPLSIIFTPEDRAAGAPQEELRAALAEGQAVDEKWHMRRDGTRIWGSGFLTPLTGDDGEPAGFIKIFQDRTIEKQAHDAYQRSNRELEEFARVAAHDLKEPLHLVSVSLGLVLAREKDSLSGEGMEWIRTAHDNAALARKMIEQLLEYARVESRGKAFRHAEMQDLLRRATDILKPAIAEAGAEITHDPLPALVLDEFQIVQLLQNLISNAIKYRSERPLKIHIMAEKREEEWIFGVRDNGTGIEDRHLQDVFTPFKRLNRDEEKPGTGLGISICKKIVERHGGSMWVESEPGRGSTFYFSLPFLEETG